MATQLEGFEFGAAWRKIGKNLGQQIKSRAENGKGRTLCQSAAPFLGLP